MRSLTPCANTPQADLTLHKYRSPCLLTRLNLDDTIGAAHIHCKNVYIAYVQRKPHDADKRTQEGCRERMERESQPTRGFLNASPATMLRVKVIRREEIAPGVANVSIVLVDTKQAPAPYLPGQFVTLALPTPRETLYRSYSLCGDGDASRPWELILKRMEVGAVSTYFFDTAQVDTLLYASLPDGTFTLPASIEPQSPLVMVALGTGIIPIMGMLRAINRMPAGERPVVHLHYASRSHEHEIFGAELAAMDGDRRWLSQWTYYAEEGQLLSADDALAHAGATAASAHWYICGPTSLKQQLQARLQDIGAAQSQIHSELFASSSSPGHTLASGEGGAGGDVAGSINRQANLRRAAHTRAIRTDDFLLGTAPRPIDDVTLADDDVTTAKYSAIRQLIGQPEIRSLARLGGVVCVGLLLLTAWKLTDYQPAGRAQASVNTISQNTRSVGATSVSPVTTAQPPAPKPTTTRVPSSRTTTAKSTTTRTPGVQSPAPQPTATRTSQAQPPVVAPSPTVTPSPILVPTATPTPTVTPTPTPSPTPTATPSPAPTATPSPAPTATPSPVVSPMPSPTP